MFQDTQVHGLERDCNEDFMDGFKDGNHSCSRLKGTAEEKTRQDKIPRRQTLVKSPNSLSRPWAALEGFKSVVQAKGGETVDIWPKKAHE